MFHVTRRHRQCSHPRAAIAKRLRIDQLWDLLTHEQRAKTLLALTAVVVRQLDVPPVEQEVRDER